MMVTMLQVVELGQLVEEVILDPPAMMADAPNRFCRIALQLLSRNPTPMALFGHAHPSRPFDLDFLPFFIRANHPDRTDGIVGERQVAHFSQLDLTIFLLPVQRLLSLSQNGGLLINFITLL